MHHKAFAFPIYQTSQVFSGRDIVGLRLHTWRKVRSKLTNTHSNMKYARAANQMLMLELEPMSMFGPSLVCGLTSRKKSYLHLMFAYICKYLTNILHIFAVALCSKVCGCYLVCFSCHPTSTNYIYSTKICCIRKSTMKHQKKSDSKLDLPKLVMVI